MNVFNGLLVTLGALTSIAVGALIVLVISGTLLPQDVPAFLFQQQLGEMAARTGAGLWQSTGIAAGFIAAGLFILALEVRTVTRRGTAGMALISSEANGTVRLSVESIAQLAQRTGRGNRDVRSIRCRVAVRPEGLNISCAAGLRMGADVPAVTADVQQNIREVVERLTGLQVIDVPMRTRYQGDRNQPVLTR